MPVQTQNYAVPHKRNDTLSFAGRAMLPSGSWTATSRLKQPESDVLIAALQVSALAPLVNDPDGYTHGFVVTYPATGQPLPDATLADQSTWPISLVDCDVQYVRASDSFTKSTPTFKVRISRDQA